MKFYNSLAVISLCCIVPVTAWSQNEEQLRYWYELEAADRDFSEAATTLGRTQAFLAVLAENSIVFRAGPVDALDVYAENQYQYRLDQLNWQSHFIDVSRSGDLGVSVGPSRFTSNSGDVRRETYGYLVGIWVKVAEQWKLLADVPVRLPGYLSLDVKPDFADTERVLRETAHPVMAAENDMQSLIDADNLFGQSINFRGGQRALLRYGLENQRVYLPGMAPAVGAEAASTVYGRFMDSHVATTNPVSMRYMGGYLAASGEMGFTYGIMSANVDEGGSGFQASYLRIWRFTNSNEWKIALEVVSPY